MSDLSNSQASSPIKPAQRSGNSTEQARFRMRNIIFGFLFIVLLGGIGYLFIQVEQRNSPLHVEEVPLEVFVPQNPSVPPEPPIEEKHLLQAMTNFKPRERSPTKKDEAPAKKDQAKKKTIRRATKSLSANSTRSASIRKPKKDRPRRIRKQRATTTAKIVHKRGNILTKKGPVTLLPKASAKHNRKPKKKQVFTETAKALRKVVVSQSKKVKRRMKNKVDGKPAAAKVPGKAPPQPKNLGGIKNRSTKDTSNAKGTAKPLSKLSKQARRKMKMQKLNATPKPAMKMLMGLNNHSIKLIDDQENKDEFEAENIPKSELIFHNESALRGTFKNVCMENKDIIFFGWMPEQQWLWDTFTYLGVWVRMGTVREWKKALHVKGPSVTLIADTPGDNNLHHLWYGKHFPTITRVMQAKQTGDNPPYFTNIIRDGSIVDMGPVNFNLGSIALIIKLLQNYNIQNNLPPIKDYVANQMQIVCTETLAVQGTKEDLIASAMDDVGLAKKIIQDYRTLAYKQADIETPTPNRCPRKVLVFAKFDSNHKRWVNAKGFYTAFKKAHPHMQVDYWEVFDRKMGFEEQIRYFSDVDIFICPNGSHQQIAIFMARGATVVEVLDEDYFAPSWNIDFSMNYLVGVRGFQVRGRLATEAEYESGIAHFEPEDVKLHSNMTWSFVIDTQTLSHAVDRHIHSINQHCKKVPVKNH